MEMVVEMMMTTMTLVDPDADSVADSQGVPEAPGVYAPIIIGDTPEERGFSMYLSGPPFNCTNTARKVLHFQHLSK